MIDDSIKKAVSFSTAKYGDTPTDKLQLTPKKYVDSRSATYVGQVTSGGTAGSIFPSGWSVTKNGTGDYTVTHNLNKSNIALVNPTDNGCLFYMNSTTVNVFRAIFFTTAFAAADHSFQFILALV